MTRDSTSGRTCPGKTSPAPELIYELRVALTAVSAAAQLMQRRSRQGTPPTPAQVDAAASVIVRASERMVRALGELERAGDARS